MKNALIFGITGQDGYYLNELLKSNGIEVIGVSRSDNRWVNGNIADSDFVSNLLQKYKPDYIFHFSAASTIRHDALLSNHAAICTGTLNILEGAKQFCPDSKIFLSGSALQFKNEEKPITENTPFEPGSPYALARMHSVYAGRYYRNKLGLRVYVGYFFHHDSPLRSERHINQKIAQAVKRIGNGSNERLLLGDIEFRKEFNFAGDIMYAVWLLVQQEKVFEVVIGCGIAHSIKEYLERCFGLIGQNWRDFVDIDPEFVSENNLIISNPALLKSLGWKPRVDITQLATMMLNVDSP